MKNALITSDHPCDTAANCISALAAIQTALYVEMPGTGKVLSEDECLGLSLALQNVREALSTLLQPESLDAYPDLGEGPTEEQPELQ